MTDFLIFAGAGTVLVAIVLIWPLVTGGARARGRDDADAQLYRDQLSELDRDIARGTISEEEAVGARNEIARRLIAATRRSRHGDSLLPAPRSLSRMAAAMTLVAAPALAAALYMHVGSPGTEDCPLTECAAKRAAAGRTNIPDQETAERLAADRRPAPPKLDPDYVKLVERLEKIVAERPMDIQGHRLLARNLARSGRWVEARKAYDRLIGILGENATAEDHADHAETMIFATGGYVSPQAIAALETALKLDPAQTMARYYAGFALRQGGRAKEAVALWQALLTEDRSAAQPRGAEWQSALVALIAETRGKPDRGPSREDVKAAGKMTAKERMAMITAMVSSLEGRLTTTGGEAEEWVRLINAYMQLGKPDDAKRIYALSQNKLSDPTARAFVKERALVMGLKLE